jgi:hypothetical protein
MAQTGYTPILIYSSTTAAQAPAAGNLTNSTLGSELAINITDGKLFYKDNANNVQVIAWKVTPATAGGTGQTSYAVGDLLYADTTTSLAKLADVATGNALISGGVGVAPAWGKIGLTTHVSGILPVANGGTNASTASITAFNNITGYTAAGATGTTSTNLVFSGSPTITTPILNGTSAIGATVRGGNNAAFISYDNLSTGAAWLVGPLNSTNSFEWQNATSSTYLMQLAATSGDLKLYTGNLVIGTSGKGIDFSATPGTGTSELFSDYEEGTFTADFVDSVIGSVGTVTGVYTKIGRMVCVTVFNNSNFPSSTPSGTLTVTGLPFTSSQGGNIGVFIARKVAAGTTYTAVLGVSSTTVTIRQDSSETGGNTATLLYTNGGTNERAGFSLTYFA